MNAFPPSGVVEGTKSSAVAWLRRGITLLLIGMACGYCLWVWFKTDPSKPIQFPLAIASERLDFGEQWETNEFRWTLPIENTTADTIHVAKFLSNCPCMTFDPPTIAVQPGQHVDVRITCDMTKTCGQNRDLPIRDYEMPIAPADESGKVLQQPWVLHGKVRSAVSLAPRAVNYGASLTRGQPFPPTTIRANAHTPLRELTAHCAQAFAVAHVSRVKGSDDQFEILVAPNSALPSGPFQFQVVIQPLVRDGAKVLETVVQIEGTIREDARIAPSAVAFPPSVIGEMLEETVRLHSASKKEFEVRQIEVASSDVKVIPVGDPATKTFRVTQRIAHLGRQTSTVLVVLKYLESGEIVTLKLHVSYHGIEELRQSAPGENR